MLRGTETTEEKEDKRRKIVQYSIDATNHRLMFIKLQLLKEMDHGQSWSDCLVPCRLLALA